VAKLGDMSMTQLSMIIECCVDYVFVWAVKGIVQYDMAIEALNTKTKIDTETRTFKSWSQVLTQT
jgi:hypothetical protein